MSNQKNLSCPDCGGKLYQMEGKRYRCSGCDESWDYNEIPGTPQEILDVLLAEYGVTCTVAEIHEELKVLHAMLSGHIENHEL